MRFVTPMWHPNSTHFFLSFFPPDQTRFHSLSRWSSMRVHSRKMLKLMLDTVSCILQHPPGNDEYGYEDASERWLPVHTVETIVRRLFLS